MCGALLDITQKFVKNSYKFKNGKNLIEIQFQHKILISKRK